MTPVSLIRLALRDAGVSGQGQAPNDEDNNDAFSHLNMMLAGWNRNRWLVYHLIDLFVLADGTDIYTVGPGQMFNTVRFDKIEYAFRRYVTNYGGLNFGSDIGGFIIGSDPIDGPQAQGIDTPLRIITAREEYDNIVMKGLIGPPQVVFYDSAYPTSRVYFYPWPAAGSYEMHLSVKEALTAFPDLTTDINLPPEYQEALLFNLGARLRLSYQMPPDPALDRLAAASLNTIKLANTQIPRARMPAALWPSRSFRTNIYAGY